MTDTAASGPGGFAERVSQIHVPEPNADREQRLLLGGVVLIAVGVVAILYAWYQVSGTTNVGLQMPYAVSGGLLGLGLIVIGSSIVIRFSLARLFRFWLARIVHEHQVQTDRTVEALGRIEAALVSGGAPSPATHAPAEAPTAPADDTPRIRKEPLRAEPIEK